MNLVFVGDRCCDHSPGSGYDQICSLFPDAGWLSGRELTAGRLSWYREPNPGSTASPRLLFHVFYGDCSGSGLHSILRARFPEAIIVSTVHQPVSRLKRDPAGWRSLFAVDAIITVSEMQARQLANCGLTASIRAIPHGVWTKTFRPVSRSDQKHREIVLFVGNYLRDWNASRRALEMLARVGVKSVILGSAAPDHLHVDDPLVEISPRVSEAELARLYDESAALLLFVQEATASNALLEAMTAGCPVICAQFPSLVDEYLGNRADSFPAGSIDQAVAHALRYVRDPARRAAKSHALMDRAETFDWSRLRPRYAAAYEEFLTRTEALADQRAS